MDHSSLKMLVLLHANKLFASTEARCLIGRGRGGGGGGGGGRVKARPRTPTRKLLCGAESQGQCPQHCC